MAVVGPGEEEVVKQFSEVVSSGHLVEDAQDCIEMEENYVDPSGLEMTAWKLSLLNNQIITLN